MRGAECVQFLQRGIMVDYNERPAMHIQGFVFVISASFPCLPLMQVT